MNVDIKYNDNKDKFTYDFNLETRFKKYIEKHFYPAFTISDLCQIYLIGGSIRDLIYAKK